MSDEDRAMEKHRAKLKEKLEELRELVAPRECPHGWWDECEVECSFEVTKPTNKPYLLDHFILVTTWVAMDLDELPAFCIYTGPRQGPHVNSGLLHEALYS